jgi:predicted MFS family arabinose efflux permease
MPTTEARARWAILALCCTARVGLGFQFQTVGSIADPLVSSLKLSFVEIGTLIGLFMAPGVFLALPAGFAGRYLSDRVLIAAGLGSLAAGGACMALADGFAVLALGRLLAGAGFVVSSLYFTKMTVDWFTGRELATAMSLLVMTWPLGIAMGQVGHGWLAETQGWRAPFVVASSYCLVGAVAILLFYRPPRTTGATDAAPSARLSSREWSLTLIASVAWAAFNAAYVVYLSFSPRVLTAGGLGTLEAASIISLASWVMIVSGSACGYVADRSGRPDLIFFLCLCVAIVSVVLLPNVDWAVPLGLALGLVGMAPAGIIMSLTGAAMAPEKRAFGMGIFLTAYFVFNAPAPAIAGWLYDRTGDPFVPILFAAAMFVLTIVGYFSFRLAQRASR